MTEWVKISDIEKARTMAMAADGIMPLSAEDIPDTHTITVSERTISVDNSEIIQNNIKTDLIELVLDGEWYDCGSIYVTLGRSTGYDEPVQLEWKDTALTFPAQLGTEVGGIDVSVVGYGNDGEMRLVTKASSNTFRVVASGYVEGVPPTEENLDILAQIVQQGQAAEDAAEAANTAATSANSAATKANSAASSANSAASSANSAATKANAAAVDAQNAYDTLQPYMATVDSCANILHREVGPDTVVTADDSFPCKPVEMTVYGNTTQNLWVNPSGTNNGITVTANADGSITVSGTATNTAIVQVISYALKPAGEYTLSIDKSVSSVNGCGVSVEWYKDNTAVSNILIGYGSTLSGTFTIPGSTEYCKLGFRVASGTTVSGTYRVMLNEGSEAEPWCPPGLNSVGQLRDNEKNLWVNPQGSANGITVTNNDDGSITLEGTATTTGSFAEVSATLKPNMSYVWTIDHAMDTNVYFAIFYGSNYENIGKVMRSAVFYTDSDVSNARFAIYAYEGGTVSGTYRIVLAEGGSAPPWTPTDAESAVYVSTSGKNLFDFHDPACNATINGIRFDVMQDGGIHIQGTSTRRSNFSYTSKHVFPPGTYTLSGAKDGEANANISYIVKGESTFGYFDGYGYNDTQTKTIDKPFTVNSFTIDVRNAGATVDTVLYPQFERSDTATDYEPPNITTTPIDLQGHTLNALPDGTRDELHIDGGGNVVLEKRVGVAEAPTAAGSWFWETAGDGIASFTLPAKSTGTQTDMTGVLRCDKLPIRQKSGEASYAMVGTTQGHAKNPAITSTATAVTVAGGAKYIYKLAEPQTIDLGTITPPTMAAPNVTAYVADDTPAEMTLDYVRDVNIVHSRLEERVAALELASATP